QTQREAYTLEIRLESTHPHGLRTNGAFRSALRFRAPTHSMLTLSSWMVEEMNSKTLAVDTNAAAKSGWPKPAMSAPRAIDLAMSTPVRMPPEAISCISGNA